MRLSSCAYCGGELKLFYDVDFGTKVCCLGCGMENTLYDEEDAKEWCDCRYDIDIITEILDRYNDRIDSTKVSKEIIERLRRGV